MPRLLPLLLAGLLTLGSVGALAHAIVTGHTLQQQPIKARAPATVLLQFNSAIEVRLSRVLLVAKGDALTRLTIRAGKKAGELAVSVPALDAGDYALKYRVFAADGHLTEDVLRFRVTE